MYWGIANDHTCLTEGEMPPTCCCSSLGSAQALWQPQDLHSIVITTATRLCGKHSSTQAQLSAVTQAEHQSILRARLQHTHTHNILHAPPAHGASFHTSSVKVRGCWDAAQLFMLLSRFLSERTTSCSGTWVIHAPPGRGEQ